MGGVPMLLMVIAATGVTYGWQPDKTRSESSVDAPASVEYIVQVTPSEWDEVQKSGEITSAIDPAVRGHVSRIIIRVGNQRPPRITPTSITAARVAARKPAPQSGSGGFGLPDLAQTTSNQVATGIDQAGREINRQINQGVQTLSDQVRRRAQAANDRTLVPPPSTRFNPSSSGLAGPRADGPSTTLNDRDNIWSRYAGNTNTGNANSVNPNSQSNFASGNANSGLGQGSTFGQLPPSLRTTASNQANDPRLTNGLGASNGAVLSQAEQMRLDRMRAGGTNQDAYANSLRSNSGLTSSDQNARPDPNLTSAQVAAGAWDIDQYGRLVDRNGVLLPSSQQPRSSQQIGTASSDNPFNRRNDSSGVNGGFANNQQNSNSAAQTGYGQTGLASNSQYSRQAELDRNRQLNGNAQVNANSQLNSNSQMNQGFQNGQNSQFDRNSRFPTNNVGLNTNTQFNGPSNGGSQNNFGMPANTNGQRSNQSTLGQGNGMSPYQNPSFGSNTQYASNDRYAANDPRTSLANGQSNNLAPNNGLVNPAFTTGSPTLDARLASGLLPNNGQRDPRSGPYYTNTMANGVGSNYPQDPRLWQSNALGTVPTGGQAFPGSVYPADNPSLASNQLNNRVASRNVPTGTDRSPSDLDSTATRSNPDSTANSGNSRSTQTTFVRADAREVAAQPLFNGLLLISVVANIYLIFWLKNLRIQFRDLVAAKRVASPTTTTAA